MKIRDKIISIAAFGMMAVLLGGAGGDGCSSEPTADQKMNAVQSELSDRGVMAVGMPNITRFAEKKLMKEILELRDSFPPTYTYLSNEMSGTVGQKLCDSFGFGLPYATQFTNPQKAINGPYTGNYTTIPQADPNGLFSPASAEGTWIVCKDPRPGATKPGVLYAEPRVIISPWPLNIGDKNPQ